MDEQGEDLIIENRGRPAAVLISYVAYEDAQALREQKRRHDAPARLNALRERIVGRNAERIDVWAGPFLMAASRRTVQRRNDDGLVNR